MPSPGGDPEPVGGVAAAREVVACAERTLAAPSDDLGAPGFSLGDEVVFSGNLLRHGKQVGRVGVVCTFVSTQNADRVEAQCPGTATLPGGQIAVQGVIVNRSLNFTLPITGGSGQYDQAQGQLVARDVSTPTQPQVELTFHLEN